MSDKSPRAAATVPVIVEHKDVLSAKLIINGPRAPSQTATYSILGCNPYHFVIDKLIEVEITTPTTIAAIGVVRADHTPPCDIVVSWPIVSGGVAKWGKCVLDTKGTITWYADAAGAPFKAGTTTIGIGTLPWTSGVKPSAAKEPQHYIKCKEKKEEDWDYV